MIDDKFLEELGLGSVPEEEKERMIADTQETLQERIGKRADEALTDETRQQLEALIDDPSGDQEAVKNWLATNLPNYNQIVAEELERIKEEIRPQVAGILQTLSSSPA